MISQEDLRRIYGNSKERANSPSQQEIKNVISGNNPDSSSSRQATPKDIYEVIYGLPVSSDENHDFKDDINAVISELNRDGYDFVNHDVIAKGIIQNKKINQKNRGRFISSLKSIIHDYGRDLVNDYLSADHISEKTGKIVRDRFKQDLPNTN